VKRTLGPTTRPPSSAPSATGSPSRRRDPPGDPRRDRPPGPGPPVDSLAPVAAPVIAVVGPTAAGKSALALAWPGSAAARSSAATACRSTAAWTSAAPRPRPRSARPCPITCWTWPIPTSPSRRRSTPGRRARPWPPSPGEDVWPSWPGARASTCGPCCTACSRGPSRDEALRGRWRGSPCGAETRACTGCWRPWTRRPRPDRAPRPAAGGARPRGLPRHPPAHLRAPPRGQRPACAPRRPRPRPGPAARRAARGGGAADPDKLARGLVDEARRLLDRGYGPPPAPAPRHRIQAGGGGRARRDGSRPGAACYRRGDHALREAADDWFRHQAEVAWFPAPEPALAAARAWLDARG
jgi:hypothetical protein